jgi:hypothetical protein
VVAGSGRFNVEKMECGTLQEACADDKDTQRRCFSAMPCYNVVDVPWPWTTSGILARPTMPHRPSSGLVKS